MAEMYTENIHSGVKCKILNIREPTHKEYEQNTILNESRLIDGVVMTRQEYALAFGEVDVKWPYPLKVCWGAWRNGLWFGPVRGTDTSPQRVCQWCYDCDLSYVEYTNLDGFTEPADLQKLACRFFSNNEVE